MIYILLWIVSYIVLGIVMELYEEYWGIAHFDEYGLDPKVDGPFRSRMKHYNREWFIQDVKDVLRWPIGYIEWKRGIVMTLVDPELKKRIKEEMEEIENSREEQ